MTTLYKPVLIESAEQAEALPIGTVSIDFDSQGQPYQASIRVRGGWYCTGEVAADGSPWLASHDVMAGDTALVPIEAEEEKRSVARHSGGGQTNYNTEAAGNPGRMGEYIASLPVESRYVTPWESV